MEKVVEVPQVITKELSASGNAQWEVERETNKGKPNCRAWRPSFDRAPFVPSKPQYHTM